ncbi:hypothetical protein F4781DRAFT_432419 [Annulohypoxylon bovei var. microspora]|nr:hypothetical protein F4781DRAFT_432419 [Annulohypoxylon bovei var. microspora]
MEKLRSSIHRFRPKKGTNASVIINQSRVIPTLEPIPEIEATPPKRLDLWLEAKVQVENDPSWKDDSEKYAIALSSIGEPNRSGSSRDPVDAVTMVIKTLKEKNESDPWLIPLPGGKKVSFDRILSKIAESVKVIATLGGSLAGLDSTQSIGVICGFLKVFAQAVIDGRATRELVADQEPIIHIVRYYAEVEQCYFGTDASSTGAAEEPWLQTGLVELYASVLHYQLRVYQYYTEGKLKLVAKSFLPSELKGLTDKVQKKKAIVDDLVREANLRRNVKDRTKLEAMLYKNKLSAIKIGTQLQQWRMQEKRRHVLDWVSEILPEGNSTKFNKTKLVDGTCQWLLTNPEFKKWRKEPDPDLFWLKGKMGAGKTHLVTAVILDIQKRISHEYVEPVLFYYSDHANRNIKATSEADIMINAILRHILSQEPELPQSILEKYDTQKERRMDLDVNDAIKIFAEVARNYPQVNVVLDALDELKPDDCNMLFRHLRGMLKEVNIPLKIFISSRTNISHIEKNAASLQNKVNISSVDIRSLNQKDIELFVEQKLGEALEYLTFTEQIVTDDKEDIKKELCNKAGGMFRWAELSIEYLARSKTRKKFFSRLKSIPDELNELYSSMYQELTGSEGELLVITLRWLMYSRGYHIRRTDVFLDAIGSEYEDKVNKDTDVCRSLVEWNEDKNEFSFAHLSVREFLETLPEFEAKCSHDHLAKFLLRQLARPECENQRRVFECRLEKVVEKDLNPGSLATYLNLDQRRLPYTLELYAISHWMDHCVSSKGCKNIGPDQISPELLEVLVQQCCDTETRPSTIFHRWLETVETYGTSLISPGARDREKMGDLVFGGYNYLLSKGYLKSLSRPLTLFCLACQHGLQNLVNFYLDTGLTPLEHHGWGVTFACIGNQLGVARNLISRGAVGIYTDQHCMLPPNLAAFFHSDMALFKTVIEAERRAQAVISKVSNDEVASDIRLLVKIFEDYWDSLLDGINTTVIDKKLGYLIAQMSRPSNENVVEELINGVLHIYREGPVNPLCNRLLEYDWYLSVRVVCSVSSRASGAEKIRNTIIRRLVRNTDINEEMMIQVLEEAHISKTSKTIIDLFNRNKTIPISREMIEVAITNGRSSSKMIRFLLERKPEFSISSTIMTAAIKNSLELVIELLKYDTKFELSKDHFILALCAHQLYPERTRKYTRLLLGRRQNPQLGVDEDIIYSALSKDLPEKHKIELLDVLFKLRHELPITTRVLLHALRQQTGPRVIQALLKYQDPDIPPLGQSRGLPRN